MKLKQIMLTAGLALSAPAFAAISPGGAASGVNAPFSGNGELFLVVYDAEAKLSYTKDLGATQNAFFGDGQNPLGFSRTWSLDDANWTGDETKPGFLGRVNAKNLQWAVVASDMTGGTAAGGIRLFTTAKVGDESKIGTMTNQQLTNGTGSTQLGTFFNAVNTTGSHGAVGMALDFNVNGTSVNADGDPGNSYWGPNPSTGFTGPNLNGNAPFSSSNAVDVASMFFAVTRSGTTQLNSVTVDPFNNAPAINGSFLLGAGGVASRTAGYSLSYALAPVPEPQTYALMLLGLAALGAVARRRRNGG